MAGTRRKRLSVLLEGDAAVEVDLLVRSLGIDGMARAKVEQDSLLAKLAIAALQRVIADCGRELGKKYPDAEEVGRFLGEAVLPRSERKLEGIPHASDHDPAAG